MGGVNRGACDGIRAWMMVVRASCSGGFPAPGGGGPWFLVVGVSRGVWDRSRWHRPSVSRRPGESEPRQPCQVGGGGEEVEVGVDFGFASDPGPAPSVFAAHEVPEFAFDLGSGGPVVGDPFGVGLLVAGVGEALLVAADPNAPTAFGVGAFGSERAVVAVVGEVGGPAALGAPAGGGGPGVGAG